MAFAAPLIKGIGAAVSSIGTSELLTAGAMGLTAYSTHTQMSAQEQAGQAEQEWQEFNAVISEQQAQIERDKALYEEKLHREGGVRIKARMRAMYGKAGLQISEGTPLLMLEQTAGEIERDALAIRRKGVLAEQRFKSLAKIERSKGAYASRTGDLQKKATLLSGGTKMLDYYMDYKGY